MKSLIHDTDVSAQRTVSEVVEIWKELHLFMILIKEIFSYIWFFKNLISLFMFSADCTAKCFSWCEMW